MRKAQKTLCLECFDECAQANTRELALKETHDSQRIHKTFSDALSSFGHIRIDRLAGPFFKLRQFRLQICLSLAHGS